jgi:ATP-dependent RNA helicase DDX24/MAK5
MKRHVRALILAPTRELALQVSSHLNACLNPAEFNDVKLGADMKGTNEGKGKTKGTKDNEAAEKNHLRTGPPHVSVAAIVGGMSAQKQRRILDRGVDVLVATPGRLWDIMENVCFWFLSHARLSTDLLG